MPKPLATRPPKPDPVQRPIKVEITKAIPVSHDGTKTIHYKQGDVAWFTKEEAEIIIREKSGAVNLKAKVTRKLNGEPVKVNQDREPIEDEDGEDLPEND